MMDRKEALGRATSALRAADLAEAQSKPHDALRHVQRANAWMQLGEQIEDEEFRRRVAEEIERNDG